MIVIPKKLNEFSINLNLTPPIVPPRRSIRCQTTKTKDIIDNSNHKYEFKPIVKPRPQCGDFVRISSTSSVYITQKDKCDINLVISDNSDKNIEVKWCENRFKRKSFNRIRCICLDKTGYYQEISYFIDDSDSDHLYESLYNVTSNVQQIENSTIENEHFDYGEFDDSFESDTESETEFDRIPQQNDSGVDVRFNKLPDPPPGSSSGLTRFAKKLRRNWSLTKNDISKSISRIAKRKNEDKKSEKPSPPMPDYENLKPIPDIEINSTPKRRATTIIPPSTLDLTKLIPIASKKNSPSANSSNSGGSSTPTNDDKRKKYWPLSKFKRSLSMVVSSDNNPPSNSPVSSNSSTPLIEKPKSVFYLNDDGNETPKYDDSNKYKRPSSGLSQKIRPTSPPPLPPSSTDKNSQDKNTTNKSQTCWYAEVGLYKDKIGESSSSTGVSSVGENSGDSFSSSSTIPNSKFWVNQNSILDKNLTLTKEIVECDENYYNLKNLNDLPKLNDIETCPNMMQKRLQYEPLYQFYNAAVLESGMRELSSDTSSWDEDEYSDVDYDQVQYFTNKLGLENNLRPSAMQLANPQSGKARSLWCEVPEVINSAILSSLSLHQKKLQEAKFELITSEASYVNSLNVLCNHFIKGFETENVLNNQEKKYLFGNILEVKKCSENLLEDLEACWQDNILLSGICDVIQKHAEHNFSPYIAYCENQLFSDRTLKQLREKKGPFINTLTRLEANPKCQSLPFYSFLMLPMQRITRLPLLADAILKRLDEADEEFKACQMALATLNKVVKECNEGARRVECNEEFIQTWGKLEFPKDINLPSSVNIHGPPRWLVRSGEVTQLISRGDDVKLTFGKKFLKNQIHMFLFTDLLVVTKKRNEDNYIVLNHCLRSFVEINSGDQNQLPVKDAAGKNLLFVTLLENQDKKQVEMMISCSSETDRTRWFEALSPPVSDDPNEILYESWNCPQVAALHEYVPQQPDELPLKPGDIVNVNKKMSDGWYQGERIQDGRIGWFPGNHVTEIASEHVRARNLRQRYRLLALSGNYLDSQRKK